jgi:NAD(P)-dependent dehydrogenase (short-subunit alcohol dehydrogenase family)
MENRPVALITGCSTGIGFEASLALARKGYRVFATLRDLKKAVSLRQAAQGLPIEILKLDVDKPGDPAQAVKTILKKTGRIDLLINNAGWGAFGALEEFTDKEMWAQYETNVFGLMRMTNAVLPSMRKQKQGRILHIGSLAGKMTFAGVGLYCSSKHAVEALTEAQRTELRPFNIEVAVIEPGSTNTQFKYNRHQSHLFLKKRSIYQSVLTKILAYGNDQSKKARGAEQVVEVILRALGDRRLAVCYAAGFDATWFPVARWFLPDRVYDLILKRMYKRFASHHADPSFDIGSAQSDLAAWLETSQRMRVALVTGASSGFGLEVSKRLAQKGYRVYATYRNPKKLENLKALGAQGIYPILMETTKSASVDKAVQTIVRKEGRIDVLINNAGFAMGGFLEDLSDQDLKDQFDTNLFGYLRVVRAVAPFMRKQRSGQIINVGSIAGRISFPALGGYAASKHAVRAFSEALRQELRPWEIDVSEVAPGSFITQVTTSARYGKNVKNPKSPNYPHTVQMEKLMEKEFAKGGPASEVAELMIKALGHRPMKPVYLAGADAKGMAFLKWLLPDALFEAFLKALIPWSRFPKNER